MNYYFKNGKIIAFTKDLTMEFDNPFENITEEFCIDENGYQLLCAIKPKKLSVGEVLTLDKKTKIRLLNDRPANFENTFDNELFINLDKIKQAAQFAEQKNNNRPILQGVYVNAKGTIIATDSFKLYFYDCGDDEHSVVLSKDLIKELTKYSGLQLFRFNNNVAQFFIEEQNITITGKLYQGAYPNVRSLLNADNFEIELDKEELTNHLNIGKYITGDSKVFHLTNKEISVYNYDAEGDIYNVELEKPNDYDFSFIFNYEYFKLCISCFENVVLCVNSDNPKNRPVSFYDNKSTDQNKTIVILIPIREAQNV